MTDEREHDGSETVLPEVDAADYPPDAVALDFQHESDRGQVRHAELVNAPVDTTNEFLLGSQMSVLRPGLYPEFRTRQQAFRFAVWLRLMADILPNEGPEHTYQEIHDAISNS